MTAVRERSMQQIDPVGTIATRPVAFVAAIGILPIALALTLIQPEQIEYPAMAIIALLVLLAACVTLVMASHPLRAPFTSATHIFVVVLAGLSALLFALSQGSSNTHLRDDWGSIALGAILFASAPYRPAKELLRASIGASLFIILVALGENAAMDKLLPLTCVVIVLLPVLALSSAAAAFTADAVRARERWQATAMAASQASADDSTDPIARLVQQDRVTILNWDVMPFFTGLVESNRVTQEDRETARAISRSIRSVMVAEADRSWLDALVFRFADEASIVGEVRDEAKLSNTMSLQQRTAVRALVMALFAQPGLQLSDLRAIVTLAPHDPVAPTRESIVEMGVTIKASPRMVRRDFAPYFAVLQLEFSTFAVHVARRQLTLRFSYEQ